MNAISDLQSSRTHRFITATLGEGKEEQEMRNEK
jgi:hypothetical protein